MLHQCVVQLAFRQDETESAQGYGVNLGAGSVVDLDAPIVDAPAGVTLATLIAAGHLMADHFVEHGAPVAPAGGNGTDGGDDADDDEHEGR